METLKSNASSFHIRFYNFLKEEVPFTVRQEVNLRDLIPAYPYPNHHVDFYIPELMTIVEVHGQQHYKPGFGQTNMDWARGVERDVSKADSLTKAGYIYIVIPYNCKDYGALFWAAFDNANPIALVKAEDPDKERKREIKLKLRQQSKANYQLFKKKQTIIKGDSDGRESD